MKSDDFQSIKRLFFMDPTQNTFGCLLTALKRHGLKMPSDVNEIVELISEQKHFVKFFLKNMNYGDPSKIVYSFFKENKDNSSTLEYIDQEFVEEIISSDKIGDPSKWCYYMYRDFGSSRRWVKKVVKNATSGHPAHWALALHRDFDFPKDWAKKVIENATCGNQPATAFDFVKMYPNQECINWGKNIIKNSSCCDKSWAASEMAKHHFADPFWAQLIIQSDKKGSPGFSAASLLKNSYTNVYMNKHFNLVQENTLCINCFSMLSWAKKIIEESKEDSKIYAAYSIVESKIEELPWLKDIIESNENDSIPEIAYKTALLDQGSVEWAKRTILKKKSTKSIEYAKLLTEKFKFGFKWFEPLFWKD